LRGGFIHQVVNENVKFNPSDDSNTIHHDWAKGFCRSSAFAACSGSGSGTAAAVCGSYTYGSR
jgi:hypothetical protein